MSTDPAELDLVPSDTAIRAVQITVVAAAPDGATVGVGVAPDGDVPVSVGLNRGELERWGFAGKAGQTFAVPGARPVVAVGTGPAADVTPAVLRDAAAAFARSVARDDVVVTTLADASGVDVAQAAQAVVEGVLLGRYRFDELRTAATTVPVEELVLVLDGADEARLEQARAGARTGQVLARATAVSRDLANTPPGYLTAPAFADVAVRLGEAAGLEVQVHDKAALVALGCGGLLGVNAGSVVEPRMVRLTYTPAGTPAGHLGLVGKGITYDSGGISLKPSNAMHAAMKMDMAGAGSVLAAMTVLAELDVPVSVSAYLACTDNMPSGSATKLGDVLTSRAGRTIEVMNTDAEGRLVMVDAIALALEDGVDAIVDIATLTGACLAALGTRNAGLIGNDDALASLVEEAAELTDETVWRLPLDRRYRSQLDSDVADIKNLGGEFAGAITAALFLAEWVGATPWAHLDIAGPMKSDTDDAWRTKGATGFGARLLAEVARTWSPEGAPA
ncbi:leucyl aminopeptidase [Cellulomonas soli]|uniref:Probable cytosol aminopeptidase n=1 Tax=Cellulomonas soli TaxID=931535 RepID=A0A512PFE7_9CELL|nr:leucyl aminopeptidase [Cellulomonas soli]NYI59298.1 leucyl aminopeptidase [Cellulomonas soli]GEP69913.1 putative cytosol aminopeptidase [Cellulomonas soli]